MDKIIILSAVVAIILASSEPQREVILFDKADTDHSGVLTQTELDQIFLAFDVDHDGEVTLTEFTDDWTRQFNLGSPNEAKSLFSKADVNDDGHLTTADIPEVFHFFDMNGDSTVNLDEFLTQWGELELAPVDTIYIDVDNSTVIEKTTPSA